MTNRPKKFCLDGLTVGTDPKFWNLSDNVLETIKHDDILNDDNYITGLKMKIFYFFDNNYRNENSPLFEIFDKEARIVRVQDLKKSYLFYAKTKLTNVFFINEHFCLRNHVTAHLFDLLVKRSENFLVVGASYSTTFNIPCYHLVTGVMTFKQNELFGDVVKPFFEENKPNFIHTPHTVDLLKGKLQETLTSLCTAIFSGTRLHGSNVQLTTENNTNNTLASQLFGLQVFCDGNWKKLFGACIINQKLLNITGNKDRVGVAFWFGLEHISMNIIGTNDVLNVWDSPNVMSSSRVNLFPNALQVDDISLFEEAILSPPITEEADSDED